jgi:hypothetical protein
VVAAKRLAGRTECMYGSCVAGCSTRVEPLTKGRVALGVPWNPVSIPVCPCDVAPGGTSSMYPAAVHVKVNMGGHGVRGGDIGGAEGFQKVGKRHIDG